MHNYYLLRYLFQKYIRKFISEILYSIIGIFLYMIIVIIIECVNIEYVTVFVMNFQKIIIFLFVYGKLY